MNIRGIHVRVSPRLRAIQARKCCQLLLLLPRHPILLVSVLFLCSSSLCLLLLLLVHEEQAPSWLSTSSSRGTGQACVHPHLEPHGIDLHRDGFGRQVDCGDRQQEWLYIDRGKLLYNQTLLTLKGLEEGDVTCTFQNILRHDDFKNVYSPTVNVADNNVVSSDFVKVWCNAKGSSFSWFWPSQVLANVKKLEHVAQRAKDKEKSLPPEAYGLSMYFVSFDSVSRVLWQELLPLSTAYFTSTLGGVVLEGYNVLGDGTPACFTPMLTGKREKELPHTDLSFSDWQHVDVYPMVWKQLQDLGYVTLYGEDMPHVGTYMYRMNGFKQQPTHHYMRPLQLEAGGDSLCLGKQASHNVSFNYLMDFVDTYKENLKFMMYHHGGLSHNKERIAVLRLADDDLLKLLKFFHKKGHLDNAVFFLFSDHGHRFSYLRQTSQGRLEERLPFFGVYVPPKFREQHPEKYENLVRNSKRLVTAFDVHATILDVAGRGVRDPRGLSLFGEVAESRTCADAGIEEQWCACLVWSSLDVWNDEVVAGTRAIITHINTYLSEVSGECMPLSLFNIISAHLLQPSREVMLQGEQHWLGLSFLPRVWPRVNTLTYKITFSVEPSLGLFEAMIHRSIDGREFSISLDSIERINAYGQEGHCVEAERTQVRVARKFCYCRVQQIN